MARLSPPITGIKNMELISLFDRVVEGAIWSAKDRQSVRSDHLSRIYRTRNALAPGEVIANLYSLEQNMPPHHFENLTAQLRHLLSEYIVTEHDIIGSGFLFLGGDTVPKRFTDYVKSLVRGAALLGSYRVVDLLLGWLEGSPFYCSYNALLEGISLGDDTLKHKGLRITTLPINTNMLPVAVQTLLLGGPLREWLGGTVLSIDCEIRPTLYFPADDNSDHSFSRRKITCPSFPDAVSSNFIDDVCAAMALVTNNGVNPHAQWFDYGELGAFQMLHGGGSFKVATWPRKQVTHDMLIESLRISGELSSKMATEDSELQTAIQAWLISLRPSELTQKFRVLRTAIELLLLRKREGTRNERTLSAVREFFPEECPNEQQRIKKVLFDAYSVASRAVHEGHLGEGSSDSELLSSAQNLCKKIILRKLRRDSNLAL